VKKILILTLAVILTASTLATAAVMDFEDLYTGTADYSYPIPSLYHGFTMSSYGGYVTKNFDYTTWGVYTGYHNGTTANVSMFTAWASPVSINRGSDFDVIRLDLAAANYNSQDATIEGWQGGSLKYTNEFSVTDTGPTAINLFYTGIDTLYILPHTDFRGANHVVIDNVVYTTAPLPSTLLFLGTGLLGLAGSRGIKKS
jgi:hypothetical protein